MAAAGSDIVQNSSRRGMDKHNLYLPYLRELGAMIILAMVLYGVWDVVKVEGQLTIKAIDQHTSAVNSLTAVQSKLLEHLKLMENTHVIYQGKGEYDSHFVGPRIDRRDRYIPNVSE